MQDSNAFLWNYFAGLSDIEEIDEDFHFGVHSLETLQYADAFKHFNKCSEYATRPADRAALLILSGNALAGMGKLPEAIRNYAEAEDTAARAGDNEGAAAACYNMGSL